MKTTSYSLDSNIPQQISTGAETGYLSAGGNFFQYGVAASEGEIEAWHTVRELPVTAGMGVFARASTKTQMAFSYWDAADRAGKAVNSVSLATTLVSLAVGKSVQLKPTVLPADAADLSLTYVSSDESVATVSATGLVTAKSEGDVTITVTSVNAPSRKASLTASVRLMVTGITLSGPTTGTVGDEVTLAAVVLPDAASTKALTWASSDASLAVVTNGVVTLLGAGTVTITVSNAESGVSATQTIVIAALPAEEPAADASAAASEASTADAADDAATTTTE